MNDKKKPTKNTSKARKMIKCKNCGHESHCGVPLRKDVDRSGTEIEVCKNCRCDNCEVKTDWG